MSWISCDTISTPIPILWQPLATAACPHYTVSSIINPLATRNVAGEQGPRLRAREWDLMDIVLADERVFVLSNPDITAEYAEGHAWKNKLDAFGTLVRMTRLFQRPKDEDFELLYQEHRFQPFWHVICHAHYVYERDMSFKSAISGPEVKRVTIGEATYEPANGHFQKQGVEHCEEDPRQELWIDAITNEREPSLSGYLTHSSEAIPVEQLGAFAPPDAIVIPPQTTASAMVREPLVELIKNVQADRILEDRVEVERVDLYYRPVFAFQYRWTSKEREAILEVDGLTGKTLTGKRTFQQYVGALPDPAALFDMGAETVGQLIPAGIAAKLSGQ